MISERMWKQVITDWRPERTSFPPLLLWFRVWNPLGTKDRVARFVPSAQWQDWPQDGAVSTLAFLTKWQKIDVELPYFCPHFPPDNSFIHSSHFPLHYFDHVVVDLVVTTRFSPGTSVTRRTEYLVVKFKLLLIQSFYLLTWSYFSCSWDAALVVTFCISLYITHSDGCWVNFTLQILLINL